PPPQPPSYRPVHAEHPARQGPTGPSPQEQAARSGLFFAEAGPTTPPQAGNASATSAPSQSDYPAFYNGHSLVSPLSPYELKAGAVVPAALLTAVDTSRAGPVIATVTQNVFDSVSGRHLLV